MIKLMKWWINDVKRGLQETGVRLGLVNEEACSGPVCYIVITVYDQDVQYILFSIIKQYSSFMMQPIFTVSYVTCVSLNEVC